MKLRSLYALVLIFTLVACAGQLQFLIVQAGTDIELGLGAVQDAERATCNPANVKPLPIAACTPASEAAGLTTERHRAISDTLADAFALQHELAVALRTHVGDPKAILARLAPVVARLGALMAPIARTPATAPLWMALGDLTTTLTKLQNPKGEA